ncbi:hypothetical protein [Streptomyces sp. NPDC059092]|uniref:hypothetical protein n=1 Tax=Streptomyces sp. NPDC059092 TaxID=3346725 RepID=UPI003699AF9D
MSRDRLLDLVEGLHDPFGSGSEADGLAAGVLAVEVLDMAELSSIDRGLEVLGPGRIGGGTAAGGAVGQGPGGDVLELNAQRDLRAGELAY